MFGKKKNKVGRLSRLSEAIQQFPGISQAELARQLNASRATINKDLGIIQDQQGTLLWEDDDGRLYPFD